MSSISSLPPFMVCGVVDWCVTVSSLGDDDIVLVRLVLIMVTEYDPYLGGAAPRPCSPRIDSSRFGGLHQTLNCSISLQEGIKVMVICLRRISYSKLPKLKL
ncbi:hypothetical protein Tco_1266926, partial [Tanacetum coccineum]